MKNIDLQDWLDLTLLLECIKQPYNSIKLNDYLDNVVYKWLVNAENMIYNLSNKD